MSFDFGEYLERIGLDRIGADAAGLRALQEAQMRAIPFENFDPLLGTVPDLSPEAVFEKLVRRRRGGYCFELNGLFERALQAAGFSTRRVLARVRMRGDMEAARSHLVVLAIAEGQEFLADAGFGGPGPLYPLVLRSPDTQTVPNGTYRIAQDAQRGETVLERLEADGGWLQLYAFDGARVSDGEIAAANHACATWDQAPFGSHLFVAGHKAEVYYGLFDRQLASSGPGGAESRELTRFEDFAELMTDGLGIALGRASLETVWRKIGG